MKELTEADREEIARLDAEIAHLESEIGRRIALREVVRTGKGYPPADFNDEAGDVSAKARQIRALVRRQLIYYLESDLKGDELLMKEVWEECATVAEVVTAKHELKEIIELIRDRIRRGPW
jgi:hypothetical protein